MTRREQSEKRALALLNSHFKAWPRLTRTYKMTLRKRVTAAKRPVTAAKGILRDLISVHRAAEATETTETSVADVPRVRLVRNAIEAELGHSWPVGHVDPPPVERPDLSAAQEARVALIRGQHPVLQGKAAYEDDLGSLERSLLTGAISQENFNQRCQAIAERQLPDWMQDYAPPAYPLPGAQSPIECKPSDGLQKAPGLSRPDPGEDGSDVIGPMPGFLDRRRATPKEQANNGGLHSDPALVASADSSPRNGLSAQEGFAA